MEIDSFVENLDKREWIRFLFFPFKNFEKNFKFLPIIFIISIYILHIIVYNNSINGKNGKKKGKGKG